LKVLARPGVVAALAVALAVAIHPGLRFGAWGDRATAVVVALALLLTLASVVRGLVAGLGARLLALGAVVLVAGLAVDGTRAHRGTLALGEGQTKNTFEEQGADGHGLGLRPLGFEVTLTRASGSVATLQRRGDGAQVTVTGSGAARLGAFRFGAPELIPTGQAVRLTVTVSDESGAARSAEVSPDEPGHVGDLQLDLERYFPDFALDDHQQPFSRSPHSRNPAALLRVRRAGQVFRVFVIRSMPGLHQVPELHESFALGAVEPEVSVQLQVTEEPAAPLLAAAALFLVAGVLLARSPA
jgi:hypothetical protein